MLKMSDDSIIVQAISINRPYYSYSTKRISANYNHLKISKPKQIEPSKYVLEIKCTPVYQYQVLYK